MKIQRILLASFLVVASASCGSPAYDQVELTLTAPASLTLVDARQRLAASSSCPLWIQTTSLSPTPRCGFGWFNSWGAMQPAELNTLNAISNSGGIVGVALPCVEMTVNEYNAIVAQPGHPTIPIWPNTGVRSWNGTAYLTLDPGQSCMALWNWGRSTGRISVSTAAVFIDSVDAQYVGIPAAERPNFRARVKAALDAFHGAGIATAANVSRYEDLAPIASSLDLRGVEHGAIVVKGGESFETAASVVGQPTWTPSVMTTSILTQPDADPAKIRTALAVGLLLDIKSGALALTINEGANTALQPSLTNPILEEFAALPTPTGARFYNSATRRWERQLGSKIVFYDATAKIGGWTSNSTGTSSGTTSKHTVRLRWTGVAAPWFYFRAAKVFSSGTCSGWDGLGTAPQAWGMDVTFSVNDPGLSALELQTYADNDTSDANGAITYGTSKGTIQVWVDGVAKGYTLGTRCSSAYSHIVISM